MYKRQELPEVLGMSDRIMVVREGLVRGVISKEEAGQENVMTLATGGTDVYKRQTVIRASNSGRSKGFVM